MPTLECYRRHDPGSAARQGRRKAGLPAIIMTVTPMVDNLPTLSALPKHLQLPRQVSATHVGATRAVEGSAEQRHAGRGCGRLRRRVAGTILICPLIPPTSPNPRIPPMLPCPHAPKALLRGCTDQDSDVMPGRAGPIGCPLDRRW
jgi:hypothetical protein